MPDRSSGPGRQPVGVWFGAGGLVTLAAAVLFCGFF